MIGQVMGQVMGRIDTSFHDAHQAYWWHTQGFNWEQLGASRPCAARQSKATEEQEEQAPRGCQMLPNSEIGP